MLPPVELLTGSWDTTPPDRLPRRNRGTHLYFTGYSLPLSPFVDSRQGSESGLQRRKGSQTPRSYTPLRALSRNDLTRLGGKPEWISCEDPFGREFVRLEQEVAIVIKLRLDLSRRDIPVLCRGPRGRDQRCRRGRKFCFLSRAPVHGSAARPGERHEHTGALGWHDSERRRLSSKTEHPAARHDPAGDYQRGRGLGRSISSHQDACADFPSRSSLAATRRDAAVRVWQAPNGADFRRNLAGRDECRGDRCFDLRAASGGLRRLLRRRNWDHELGNARRYGHDRYPRDEQAQGNSRRDHQWRRDGHVYRYESDPVAPGNRDDRRCTPGRIFQRALLPETAAGLDTRFRHSGGDGHDDLFFHSRLPLEAAVGPFKHIDFSFPRNGF